MAIIQFPSGFRWGAATASYQIEGAAHEDGRGLSIWDTFSHTPGKVHNGDNGDVACDSYHRFEEDISLMKELGITCYRFSVAWPRIYPNGRGEVNPKGLEFYHRFVDKLLEAGIEPFCTLYHWDLPQALQDEGGWNHRGTIDAFVDYASLMFREFSGKIKHWITFNEPWCISFLSHYIGVHAPGLQDLQTAVNAAHHLHVAHGKTVQAFRALGVEGHIGYAPNTEWNEPYTDRPEDVEACRRATGWFIDWFFDPVFKGEYPDYLVQWFQDRGATVPIQPGDMETIAQKIDFLGINYYTGRIGRYREGHELFHQEPVDPGFDKTDIGWNIYPAGFTNVLTYIHQRYGDIPIYITENGACYNDEPGADGRVRDVRRTDYLRKHLTALHRAMAKGVNVQGYFTWSLMDNFEWAEGYSKRFGLIFVNYNTLERIKKDSFYWYRHIVRIGFFEV